MDWGSTDQSEFCWRFQIQVGLTESLRLKWIESDGKDILIQVRIEKI